MKRRWALVAGVLLLVLLVACAEQASLEEDGLQLWFLVQRDEQHSQIAAALGCSAYQGEESVPALLNALLGGPPADSSLYSLIPAGVEVLDWSVEGRVASVSLAGPYGELTGIDRTLTDYCITLTLCQLPGVDGVRIAAGGEPQGRVLRAGDVIFSGAEEEPVDVPATLYFRRAGGDTLGSELRVFRLTEEEVPAKAVLEALIAGPEDQGLVPLLPADVAVLSAWVDDGLCHADLSAALLSAVPDDPREQELVISSIVETLCSLDQVDQVRLLVEGEPLAAYGSLALSDPLLPE